MRRVVVIIDRVVVDAETAIRPSASQLAAQTRAALEAAARAPQGTPARAARSVPTSAAQLGGAIAAALGRVLDGLAAPRERRHP